jgi:hypothetical protein
VKQWHTSDDPTASTCATDGSHDAACQAMLQRWMEVNLHTGLSACSLVCSQNDVIDNDFISMVSWLLFQLQVLILSGINCLFMVHEFILTYLCYGS